MQALAGSRNSTHRDIPRLERRKLRTLAQRLASCANRQEPLYRAHMESARSMSCNRMRARVVGIARNPADCAGGGGERQGPVIWVICKADSSAKAGMVDVYYSIIG